MRIRNTIAGSLLASALMLALAGCDDQGALEEAGEAADEAVEDAGEAVEDATDGG